MGGVVALAWWSMKHPSTRSHEFARWGTCAPLRRSKTSKHHIVLGRFALSSWRATPSGLKAPADHSVLVVGPTQSGKTSSIVIPAITAWDGPVLVASVKDDVVVATSTLRRSRGEIGIVDPSRSHGIDSRRLDPVAMVQDWDSAKRVGHALTQANAEGTLSAESHFWTQMAAKTLSVLCFASSQIGGDIAQVLSWVQSRGTREWVGLIEHSGHEAALSAAMACAEREERQAASISATIEAIIDPLVTEMKASVLDPAALLGASNTLYCCAPSYDQRRYRALFALAVDEVLRAAFARAQREGGRLKEPLLVVLDEAAAIAPLPELDVVAATCASHGITLLSVFQDLAQIHARWGTRAESIINNHRTRVLLAGSSDPLVGSMAHQALGKRSGDEKESSFDIRTLKSHRGLVVSGSMKPVRLVLGKQPKIQDSVFVTVKRWITSRSVSILARPP